MLKTHYQIAKKQVQEEVDSADELEPAADESAVLSQKLPESYINLNPSRFSSRGAEHESNKDRENSPLKERVYNNQIKPRREDQDEMIKKLLYKSPKEAANEYMAITKQQQQANQPQMLGKPGSKTSNSPSKSKNYPYSFNANKENPRRDEGYIPQVKSYDEPVGVSPYTELAAKIYNQKFNSGANARQTQMGNTGEGTNLLLSANEAQKIEEKRYFASRDVQEDVVDRLMKQGEVKTEHNKALTNAYLSKELAECTFAPRVHSNKPRRNFNQFLEDQKQFQTQTEMKKKRLQEQAMMKKHEEESQYRPAINQNSVKMLEKKSQGREPAYQRLYSLGKNAQTKHMQVIAENDLFNRDSTESSHFIGMIGTKGELSKMGRDTPKFTPNIQKKSKNLKREERVDSLLYNDALRRQHKMVEASKMKTRSISMSGLSSSSKRALAMRFIKEFDIAILEFLEMGKDPKLNYLQLNEFLKKLCFLKESEHIENPHFTSERLLLYDMWYTLNADKYSGVHRRNLLVFLLAILKLHFPITKIQSHNGEEQASEREQHKEDKESSPRHPMLDQNNNPVLPEEEGMAPRERRVIGFFDEDGNYELNEEEVRKLHKLYEPWYLNRLCSGDNLGQLISTRSQQEFTHHPEINETSRNLAQQYREKMLEGTAELIQQNKIAAPKDGKLTHADLLIVSKKVIEEKVNKYGELLKEEQAKECTFKPQTLQYDQSSLNSSTVRPGQSDSHREGQSMQSRKQNSMPAESMGKDRVYELYSLAKPRILKKDKDTEEVEYEKNAEECTFQPNTGLTRESKTYASEPTELFAKGIEKAIERMRVARVEKEQQLQQMERGFTTGSEGHFVFALDKKKFAKDSVSSSIDSRKPGMSKLSRRESAASGYSNGGTPYNMNDKNPNVSYNHAPMMKGDEYKHEEEMERDYEHQEEHEDYDGPVYGIEQDQGLGEVQEDENEIEGGDDHHDRYENEENDEEQPQMQRDENERVPLLFVDVNLGQGRTERIIVYEGDRSDDLAHKFAEEHGLDPSMKGKLKELLDSHIASLLSRIDEELNSGLSETDRQHHSGNYMHDQIQEEEDYIEEGSYGER